MKFKQSNFFLMDNVIQNYAWGSVDSMHSLFDIVNPQRLPQAELWMGAHPNGCSHIWLESQRIALCDFINSDPDAVLGSAASFAEIPFLFKVLAAEKALSVQVHPNKNQAETGFTREDLSGIARDADNRNYRDANHKPELVFALTPYQAMNGFRDLSAIYDDFAALHSAVLQDALTDFKVNLSEAGLALFFSAVLNLAQQQKQQTIEQLLAYCAEQDATRHQLITELAKQYPGDIGLFSPLFLHIVTLQPGEAMFLNAGTPHAYIQGTALEIMANSDNVLRAGLTPKYIDVNELIDKTRFTSVNAEQLLLAPNTQLNSKHFPVPVADFCFSVYQQPQADDVAVKSAEILFAIDAPVFLEHMSGEKIAFNKGESIFIPAYAQAYKLSTTGTVARAYNI